MNRFASFIKITGVLFIVSSIAAFSLYFGLRGLLNQLPVIIWVPFAHLTFYHDQHPVPYLLSISLIFALIGALWLTVIAPKFSKYHRLQMALLPILTVLLTGPIWGMLWVYDDMRAGFFPPFPVMMGYIGWGAKQGLFLGLNGAIASFPLNVVAYVVAYLLLLAVARRFGSRQSMNASVIQAGG